MRIFPAEQQHGADRNLAPAAVTAQAPRRRSTQKNDAMRFDAVVDAHIFQIVQTAARVLAVGRLQLERVPKSA